mgnify:CR=1 FL=1
MKKQSVDIDPVFHNPKFAARYAKEQQKVFKWMNPPIIKGLQEHGFRSGKILDDGWTVVTTDGGYSAHYENCILIGKNGPEILTVAG